jgi:hypothetical protein
MSEEQLKLFTDLYAKFNKRCEYICQNLLNDLRNYKFMYRFELSTDNSEVDCWGSDDDWCGEGDEHYDRFPIDFIYKSDEEILQWKNEILEKQRKAKEKKEKLRQQREQECEYQRYIELKRKFEKKIN